MPANSALQPPVVTQTTPPDNTFYDSEARVPSSEMARKSGPRRADPRTEPGSSLVVVTKGYGAQSGKAQIVAARRAAALGRHGSALDIYERLYAKDKRDPNVLLGRAVALQNLGRVEESITAYQALLDAHPDTLVAEINMLGLMARRYPAVALERLTALREANPAHPGIVAQMAVVSAELGRLDDAVQFLGVAAGMEPKNAGHVFNMAVIADRAGRPDQAVSYYERALEIDTIHGSSQTIPRDAVFERLAQLR